MSAVAPRTLIQVVQLSGRYLEEHGCDSPRLDSELICAHALGIGRLDLYLQFDRPLDETELGVIRDLVRRRGRGEPVAHLTGEREFYSRRFSVSSEVLIPRPDTETLVTAVLQWSEQRDTVSGTPMAVVDMGTGSGCIAITLALERSADQVTGVDISAAALRIARGNAESLGAELSWLEGDWWQALARDAQVDVLVSNPPYVDPAELATLSRDVRDFEPALALCGSGDPMEAYRRLLAEPERIRPGGLVALEIDWRRADDVEALVAVALPGWRLRRVDDLTGRPRVITACAA